MAAGFLPEPQTEDDAQVYLDREVKKPFGDGNWWSGRVVSIDTEIQDEEGNIENGLFFAIRYEDDDQEHMAWPEFLQWLVYTPEEEQRRNEHNARKRKGAGHGHGPAAKRRPSNPEQTPAGAATTAAHTEPPAVVTSRGRRVRVKPEVPEQATPEASPDENQPPEDSEDDDEEEEASDEDRPRGKGRNQNKNKGNKRAKTATAAAAGAGAGSAGPSRGGWRRGNAAVRAEQQQQQQQEETGAAEEDAHITEEQRIGQLLNDQDQGGLASGKLRTRGLAGHLRKIKLINFMCHENFEMDFSPHVNFVSGTNGSGKSAVLQGLQCALGASARETGRGTKLEELVKTGADEAKVQVTLWNTGDDAYHPEKYGDSITIERSFRRNGASVFKLYTSRGQKVPNIKKKDIDHMLDHLSINAVNPLAIMTQETTRSFLSGSCADKEKFKLFMQATLLQSFQDNLNMAGVHVDEHGKLMKSIMEEYNVKKKELNELKAALKKLQDAANLVELRNKAEAATAWRVVQLTQAEVEQMKEKLEGQLPREIAEFQDGLQQYDQQLEELRSEEASRIERMNELNRLMEQHNSEIAPLTHQQALARKEKTGWLKGKSKAEATHRSITQQIKLLMESKAESGESRNKEYVEKMARYQLQVDRAQAAKEKAEAEERELNEAATRLKKELDEIQGQIGTIQTSVQRCQQQLEMLKQEERQVQKAQKDKLAAFGGDACSRLRAAADRKRAEFDILPIGPIGAHLSVEDTRWSKAAEVALGAHLQKWICHSHKDAQLLRKLAADVRFNNLVIMITPLNRAPYDQRRVDSQHPHNNFLPLRAFVKIDHPTHAHIIDNKLMDLTHYEKLVVDVSNERIRDAIYNRAAGEHVIRGIDASGNSFTRRGQRSVEVYPARRDMRCRLGCNPKDNLVQLQELMAEETAKQQELNKELFQLRQGGQMKSNELGKISSRQKQLHTEKGRAERTLRDLQAQLQELSAAQQQEDDEVDPTAEQLLELQEQLTASQLDLDKALGGLAEATQKEQHAKALMDAKKGGAGEVARECEQMSALVTELGQKIAKVAAEKEELTVLLQKMEKVKAGHEAALAAKEQQLQEERTAAETICDEASGQEALEVMLVHLKKVVREKVTEKISKTAGLAQRATPALIEKSVEDNMVKYYTPAGISTEMRRLEAQLSSVQEAAGGSEEDIAFKVRKAEYALKEREGPLNNVRAVGTKMKGQYLERCEAYQSLFESVKKVVSAKFRNYMLRRQHDGLVVVNTDNGTLKLQVKMNALKDKTAKVVNDLKQLSGGERSTTTVAFFLALGHWTESPFRVMDEYDVYMDSVNRRYATQTLLQFAMEFDHLQFVFLSPQDLQAVEDAKQHLARSTGKPLPEGFVTVVQMRPARANATRADY